MAAVNDPAGGVAAPEPPPPGPQHVPRLRYRLLAEADLPECLALLPPHLGLDADERRAVAALWPRLIHEPAIISGTMEDLARPAGERIVAWGVSFALPPELVREESLDGAPRAYIARRLYRGLVDGRVRLMGDREIGRLNARGELSLLILHYSMRHNDLSHPYVHKVLVLANDTFRAFHDGYRLASLYYENAALAESFAIQSGFLRRPFADEAELQALPAERRPSWYLLTRDEAAKRLPGTPARNCFEHAPPRFRFHAAQRQLLWRALFDEPDERLCAVLDVSPHGLKKLWRGIYERIESVEPAFFGDEALADDGKRGPEKRRQVLAYVRQRLEELRPWSP